MILWTCVIPLVSAYRAGVVQMYPRISTTAAKTNEANLKVLPTDHPDALSLFLKLIGMFLFTWPGIIFGC